METCTRATARSTCARRSITWRGCRFGLHNLRHSLSNWLVNRGKVDPKTVQEMLRHEKVQTTLDL
jgi:integrase